MHSKTRILIGAIAGSAIVSAIFLLIAYWLYCIHTRDVLTQIPVKSTTQTITHISAKTVNNANKQKLASQPEYDLSFTVNPTLELEGLIKSFEKELFEEAQKEADLASKILEWQNLRKNGTKLWGSQKWMKEPSYYKSLNTIELAEECFSRQIFANEMAIFDNPRFAFERLKIFHNGFAELFGRKNMWEGILHVYEYLLLKIDPKSQLKEIVDASDQFLSLSKLYEIDRFKEQVKNGRERIFLATNLHVLKRYKWYIENYDPQKWGTTGFFCEPCAVAQVALMLTKQVDPQRYTTIQPTIANVRWTEKQKVEDLKSFIDLVIISLDGIVPNE